MLKKNTKVKGSFVDFLNDKYYKIEEYDQMDNFFMSITSSSDIWNFCWSQGGITAGRIDSNNAVFPYYTADKVYDARQYTGSYTALHVKKDGKTRYWQPFYDSGRDLFTLERNLYKNTTGTKVYFEEINRDLGLSFTYGWTSSDAYGLVREAKISNIGPEKLEVEILDGCQNILCSSITSDFQNENSILLDAYKKTDVDPKTNLGIFSVSSIVSDRAEPSEGLYANISWFSTDDKVYTDPNTPAYFKRRQELPFIEVLKGKRPSFFIQKNFALASEQAESWYQVFDTDLDASDIALVLEEIKERAELRKKLSKNIEEGIEKMRHYINLADGFQETGDTMASVHHSANVMFNIMRGGIFPNEYTILTKDFLLFVSQKNTSLYAEVESILEKGKESYTYQELKTLLEKTGKVQIIRIFYDYMPLSFSRRHGDPSRPWNKFNIHIQDKKKNPILTYQGNWRDIFQNWEPLAFSFPYFLPNMISLFLDSMTADGYNPGALSRESYHWEIPNIHNPWANTGYWTDHQVIYLSKLLELAVAFDDPILSDLNVKRFSSTRVPYKLKSHKEIMDNPRESISFDYDLNNEIDALKKEIGMDAQLYIDADNKPILVSMTTKLLQVALTKLASLIPGGGLWLNTQRPEWNDANNALAGYGLSVVTLCYLYRYLSLLKTIFSQHSDAAFSVTPEVKNLFTSLVACFKDTDAQKTVANAELRKTFIDTVGTAFEVQRKVLYNKGLSTATSKLTSAELLEGLELFLSHCKETISVNQRKDGLFHAYNTMKIGEDGIEISYLSAMLEGQVAILSAGLLNSSETERVCKALRESDLFIDNQYSYILYPNKELPLFLEKNAFSAAEAEKIAVLKKMIDEDDHSLLKKDIHNVCHFNPDFVNAKALEHKIDALNKNSIIVDEKAKSDILALYEKVFNHQSFTGRSGTFYAYEGLGSIYWHMVAKLMLAVQENMWSAYDNFVETQDAQELERAKALTSYYFDVRKGIGYKKKPEEYGAFPFDPYSHTPYEQGAKQPGMTGQVKEEILTRMGELGLRVINKNIVFNPVFLEPEELGAESNLRFTWGSIPVRYSYDANARPSISITQKTDAGNEVVSIEGLTMPRDWTERVFARDKSLVEITVHLNEYGQLL